MITLTGYVDNITFRNEDNGYTILTLTVDKKAHTCVGVFGYINVGEFIEVVGEKVVHNVYGEQIKVSSYSIKVATDEQSAMKFLGSGAVKGIGPALALRIVDEFGDDTFRIIEEEPERLAEVRGISMRKAMDICDQMEELHNIRDVMIFLQGYGITPSMATKIYDIYGMAVYDIIKTNPYRLADDVPGIGFKIVDDIARKAGVSVNASIRIKSGMCYALTLAAGNGHTFLPKKDMVAATLNLLGLREQYTDASGEYDMDGLDDCYSELIDDKKIVVKDIEGVEAVFGSVFYNTEVLISEKLKDLNIQTKEDEYMMQVKLDTIEKMSSIELNGLQKQAIMATQNYGVSVITGGPGTGKTTTINAIIQMFESDGLKVALAAPTGRAAKRMSEATQREAMTIHRLVEVVGTETETEFQSTFAHNEENPIDADVIIVDEMSMVDTFLICALLRAISLGTRLVLVGDVNQLASVGPGNVLKDIIASDRFQVTYLTKVYRQEGKSGIVTNAHKINKGEHFPLDNSDNDFLYIKRDTVEEVRSATIGLLLNKLPEYVGADVMDIQVLTPMRKGVLGVEGLNVALQRFINPPERNKKELEYGGITFREGDKVMQIKNNYDQTWEIRNENNTVIQFGTGVFNGDIGIVKEINPYTNCMEVLFDDERYVLYEDEDLLELELAYAITIHKSQGSEYPAIVIPLMHGFPQLMTRNLIYTGITRAMKCVCIVGKEEVFQQMIDNRDQKKRYSGLKGQLEQTAEE